MRLSAVKSSFFANKAKRPTINWRRVAFVHINRHVVLITNDFFLLRRQRV